MLKRAIILQTLFFCFFHLNAQQKSDTKLNVEAGVLAFSKYENLGLFFNIEPKLRVSNNAFIGLRMGVTINSQSYENNDNPQFIIDEKYDNGFFSALATYSYYWNEKRFLRKYILRPYIGFGAGPSLLAYSVDVFQTGTMPPADDMFQVPVDYRIGFLLKAGVELGKLTLGLEYNLIPKADIEVPSGQKIGIVNGSYLGFSLGFTI